MELGLVLRHSVTRLDAGPDVDGVAEMAQRAAEGGSATIT